MGPLESAIKDLEQASKSYCSDLEALSDAQILETAGGTARKPVDFTYEVAIITRRIAARFKAIEPPTMPEGDEWIVAPLELQSKIAITEYMRSSCDELLEAAKSIPEGEDGKLIGPPGKEQPAFSMASFAAMHIMYHDAQLNFIQTLAGDMAVHWG